MIDFGDGAFTMFWVCRFNFRLISYRVVIISCRFHRSPAWQNYRFATFVLMRFIWYCRFPLLPSTALYISNGATITFTSPQSASRTLHLCSELHLGKYHMFHNRGFHDISALMNLLRRWFSFKRHIILEFSYRWPLMLWLVKRELPSHYTVTATSPALRKCLSSVYRHRSHIAISLITPLLLLRYFILIISGRLLFQAKISSCQHLLSRVDMRTTVSVSRFTVVPLLQAP
jgi:hypothetical protein